MPKGGTPIGAAKVAALKIGCSVDHYLAQRAAGLRWCSTCREWRAHAHHGQCRDCRREAARIYDATRRTRCPQRSPAPKGPPHPPQRWCSCACGVIGF